MNAPAYTGSMLGRVFDYHVDVAGRAHVVRNVEGLCRSVLNRFAAAVTPPLEPAEYDDSLRHLLGAVVELATTKYDPGRGGAVGDYLYARLPGVLIDYWRGWHGRNGEKRILDARAIEQALRDAGVDDGDSGVRGRGGAAGEGAADADADRTFPREWAELPGDRGADGPVGGLGIDAGAGGGGRAARAGAAEGGRAGGQATRACGGAAAFLDCGTCGWRHYPAAPNGLARWHFPLSCAACGSALGGLRQHAAAA